MKYVVFLAGYVDDVVFEELPEAEQAAWMTKHDEFDAAVNAREGCAVVGGEALTGGDAATVFRQRAGKVELTDGPYAEATEGIGGFYVVEAPDLDTLTDLLTVLPGYVMEIRPVDPAYA